MTPGFRAGTLPAWVHPIRPKQRLGDIDSLSGVLYTPRTTILNAGDAVPGYPGMIIQDLDTIDSGMSFAYSIQAEGSLNNALASKRLSRSESRTIGASFETFGERHLTWQSARKACTGVASTNVLSTPTPHGCAENQRICFLALSGGAGLIKQNLSTLARVYWMRDVTSTTFKVSTTQGGTAEDFTTDISAGYFMVAEFFPGTPHADWPNMYLTECRPSDNNTPWRIADCTYIGKMWDKPYHRVITVNGMQISSSEKVTLPDVDGGDSTLRYRLVELPEVVLTDTYVDVADLPTDSVPSIATPPNAPPVFAGSVSGSDDETVLQWPYGWSRIGTQHVETINSGIPLTIYSVSYKFKLHTLLK